MQTKLCNNSLLSDLINTNHYPITDPVSMTYRDLILKIHEQLKKTGCAQLSGFLKNEAVTAMCQEVDERLNLSDTTSAYQNAYLCDDNPDLPKEHPIRQFQKRRNKFLCRDRIDVHSPMIQLFLDGAFMQFIRDATGMENLFPFADPISGMLVNIQHKGDTFPWHFDTNEISISFSFKNATSGGMFQFVPNIRSENNQNYNNVKAILEGDEQQVVELKMMPGDLQIFWGRYSLHRVTEVKSDDARYSLIYGYAKVPKLCNSKEVALATFGRFYPEQEKGVLRV
jgi:hypothetical protein